MAVVLSFSAAAFLLEGCLCPKYVLADRSAFLADSAHVLADRSAFLADNRRVLADNRCILADSSLFLADSHFIRRGTAPILCKNLETAYSFVNFQYETGTIKIFHFTSLRIFDAVHNGLVRGRWQRDEK